MLTAQGHVVARRSRDDRLTPETDIFLGDSMGEMGLYLRLTEVAFVGRSLIGEGGQNPLEPAMLGRSEEHTSELQSLMRISYAVFCLKKKKNKTTNTEVTK